MVRAKRATEVFLMGQHNLLTDVPIYNQVKEVWESQKRLVARRMELESLMAHGRSVEEKLRDEESYLNSKLTLPCPSSPSVTTWPTLLIRSSTRRIGMPTGSN